MALASAVLRVWIDAAGTERVLYWCPGCKYAHHVTVNRPGGERPNWNWDRNAEKPTLSPSVRHFYNKRNGAEITTCHYFIKAGKIEFCGDCRHELSGKTVDLPPLPPPEEYGYPDEL